MKLTRFIFFSILILAVSSCINESKEATQDHTLIKKKKNGNGDDERESKKRVGQEYEMKTPFPRNLAGVYFVDNEFCITDHCEDLNPGILTNFEKKILKRRSQTSELTYVIDSIYPNNYFIDSNRIEVSHMSIRDTIDQESFALTIKYDKSARLYTIHGLPQEMEFDMLYDTLFADRNHSDHVPHYAEICY